MAFDQADALAAVEVHAAFDRLAGRQAQTDLRLIDLAERQRRERERAVRAVIAAVDLDRRARRQVEFDDARIEGGGSAKAPVTQQVVNNAQQGNSHAAARSTRAVGIPMVMRAIMDETRSRKGRGSPP